METRIEELQTLNGYILKISEESWLLSEKSKSRKIMASRQKEREAMMVKGET